MRIDRVSLRLGSLIGPLKAAAERSGSTLSAEIRYRLAESLGVAEPELPEGNPEIRQYAARGAAKRWGKE
jgi:hypothetical protein